MAQQNTPASGQELKLYFGKPVGYMKDGERFPLYQAFVIRPNPDPDGEIAIAYLDSDTYQWTDRCPLNWVTEWPLRSHEDHGWSNPEQTRNLLNQISTFEEALNDQREVIDTLRDKVRQRDIDIEEKENRIEGLRAALACSTGPVSEVPGWAHNCAGAILRISSQLRPYIHHPTATVALDAIVDLTKIIRREEGEPTPPPTPDIHPDKPF